MSLFLLILMIASIAGFAMMSAGPNSQNNQNIPENLPIQKIEDNGNIYWVAIKNKEIFYFTNIDNYENNELEKNIAQQIKSKENLNIYVDESFTSSDAIYLIEKALNALKINHNRITTLDQTQCDSNTLILTTNQTFTSNCLTYTTKPQEEYMQSEILIYHLVKN